MKGLLSSFLALAYLAGAAAAQLPCPPGDLSGLDFDGVGDRVDCGAWTSPVEHTLEAWVRVPSGAGSAMIAGFAGNAAPDNCGAGFSLRVGSTGKVYYNLDLASCGGGGTSVVDSATPVDTWTHYACTYDGTVMTLYKDGELVGQAGATFDPYDRFTIGAQKTFFAPGWGGFFAGDVADVRVWSFARSLIEIRSTKDTPLTGSPPGLIGYWPIGEGAGAVTADLAGAHPGAVTGAAWIATPHCVGTGSGFNPADSLLSLSGGPTRGVTWTVGVHNPLATQAPGALAFLAASFFKPPPYLPAGVLLPGWGMAGGDGELLIVLDGSAPVASAGPVVWDGLAPAPFPIALPTVPSTAGIALWMQGLIVDPLGPVVFGLTEGWEVVLGD